MQTCTPVIVPNWVIMLTNVSLWKFQPQKDPQHPAVGNVLGPPISLPTPSACNSISHETLVDGTPWADWKVWQKLVWSVKGWQPEGGEEGLSLWAPGLTHPSPL